MTEDSDHRETLDRLGVHQLVALSLEQLLGQRTQHGQLFADVGQQRIGAQLFDAIGEPALELTAVQAVLDRAGTAVELAAPDATWSVPIPARLRQYVPLRVRALQ